MLFSNKRAAFSLVEVMIAMVIVATIAIVSARSFVSMKKSEVGLREADICRSYLDSAFKNIDSYGVMPTLMDTTLIASTKSNVPAGQRIKGVTAEAAFPIHSQSMVNFENSAQLTQLNTPTLLGGTIAMLNGIYNDRSTNCATTVTGNSYGLMPATPPGVNSASMTLSMTITPFDLSTGAPHDCSADNLKTGSGILAPKGVKVTGISANPQANAELASGIHNDIGFAVKVSAQFSTNDGRAHFCSATHNFSYVADLDPPLPPDSPTISFINVGSETPHYAPHSVTLTVGYMGAISAKPGVVLMCEDLSSLTNPNDSIFALNGDPFITSFSPQLGHKFAPCEWVTLCGKSQRSLGGQSQAQFTPTADYRHFSMSTTWANNGASPSLNRTPPYGCVAKIGVVAVDMAGNISSEVDSMPVTLGALQDCSGAWTPCVPNSATCGTGAGLQTYLHQWEAQYGGSPATCAFPNNTTRACDLAACPIVNCVGGWGSCAATGSPSCGAGSGQMTYTVSTQASGGGSACATSNGQTQGCVFASCPPAVDCVGSWSTCAGTCGTGSQLYTISTPSAYGGTACEAANGTSRSCSLAACPTPTPTPVPPTPTPTPASTPYPYCPSGCMPKGPYYGENPQGTTQWQSTQYPDYPTANAGNWCSGNAYHACLPCRNSSGVTILIRGVINPDVNYFCP